jgi:2-iminobutanoate/2-iminopropanoate deaminase
MRSAVTARNVAPPVGPFSPGVIADGGMYVSGQVGQDPATGQLVAGGVERQAGQAIANLAAVLEAGGRTLDDVP